MMQHWYSPNAVNGKAAVSNSFSIQSLILLYACNSQITEHGTITDTLAQQVVIRAKTDFDSHCMARGIIVRSTNDGLKMPPTFCAFTSSVVAGDLGPKERGNRYYKIRTRNVFGGQVLLVLTDPENGFGIQAARNHATQAGLLSACEILESITEGMGGLSITYNAATKLWQDRERFWCEAEIMYALAAMAAQNIPVSEDTAIQLLELADKHGVL